MKRRGVLTVVMAMELVFIAVLLILFGSISSYGSDKAKTQELIIAEDMTLLLDTMQSSPFDFEYEYEIDLFGKNITIDGTHVSVTDSFNINAVTKALLYGRHFSKAGNMRFPAKQSLQGSLLTITKSGKQFTFTDKGGSKSIPYVVTAKRLKEDLAIQVTYTTAQNQGQNLILESLKDKTQAEISMQGFSIESTSKANLYIIFSFADETANHGEQHRITYSLAQQAEVEYLAEKFQEALDERLTLPITTSPKSYNNKPTVAFHFLDAQQSIMELNSDSLQSIIALTIAGYFEQTYKEAQP